MREWVIYKDQKNLINVVYKTIKEHTDFMQIQRENMVKNHLLIF